MEPTQNFVLIQFVPKQDRLIIAPDSNGNPTPANHDIKVVACGPDVPQNPPILPGDTIHIRGDSKIFPVPPQEANLACVPYTVIMAVESSKVEEQTPFLFPSEIGTR